MGIKGHFVCDKCSIEAFLGIGQPYMLSTGTITDKFCNITKEFVTVTRNRFSVRGGRISCMYKKRWRKSKGILQCQGCKGECLKNLEIIVSRKKRVIYKCPVDNCSGNLVCMGECVVD